jgi:hypothetical protein
MTKINENKIIDWLKDKIRRPKSKDKVKVDSVRPGIFYTMNYISKLYEEDKLEFYDKQPLILCLDTRGIYMWGINFHYIPKTRRVRAINRLKKRYPEQWDANKILPNVSYKNIAGELAHVEIMVKQYIIGNISKISKIENVEMETAVLARTEDFIGRSAESIWKMLGVK